MNFLDLVILAFAIGALGNGIRRGFTLSFFTYLGLVAGTALGAFLAPPVQNWLQISSTAAPFVGLGMLFIGSSVGSSIGYALGDPIRRRLLGHRVGRLDSGAGAVFSALTVLSTAWFLGLALVRIPVPAVAGAIEGSAVLRTIDGIFPRPPSFLAGVEQIIAGVNYPRVFDAIGSPNLPGPVTVDPAVAQNPAVAAAAKGAVKIRSLGCGGEVFGSGFPVANDYLISNAHVVAGTTDQRVFLPDGRFLRATVVLFDSQRDVSILHVSGLKLTPFKEARATRGTQGATIGYPGGGNEVVGAAAVRTKVTAVGRDIYGQTEVSRQIYVLTADIRPGNSGGPLVDTAGKALGVVFANSTTDPSEGYALTDDEVAPDISAGVGRTAPVSVGACAA